MMSDETKAKIDAMSYEELIREINGTTFNSDSKPYIQARIKILESEQQAQVEQETLQIARQANTLSEQANTIAEQSRKTANQSLWLSAVALGISTLVAIAGIVVAYLHK